MKVELKDRLTMCWEGKNNLTSTVVIFLTIIASVAIVFHGHHQPWHALHVQVRYTEGHTILAGIPVTERISSLLSDVFGWKTKTPKDCSQYKFLLFFNKKTAQKYRLNLQTQKFQWHSQVWRFLWYQCLDYEHGMLGGQIFGCSSLYSYLPSSLLFIHTAKNPFAQNESAALNRQARKKEEIITCSWMHAKHLVVLTSMQKNAKRSERKNFMKGHDFRRWTCQKIQTKRKQFSNSRETVLKNQHFEMCVSMNCVEMITVWRFLFTSYW